MFNKHQLYPVYNDLSVFSPDSGKHPHVSMHILLVFCVLLCNFIHGKGKVLQADVPIFEQQFYPILYITSILLLRMNR